MKPLPELSATTTLHLAKVGAADAPPSSRPALLDAAPYQFVREGFQTQLKPGANLERHLRGVLADALAHPGGLVRAQLAYSVMTALGGSRDSARAVGCAIEYFHTASLLFDDLPAMDDATHRRGQLCSHLVHGESAAMLGALALINEGYRLLWGIMGPLPEAARLASSALVGECLGASGILNGQARDLHFGMGPRNAESVLQVADGKTVTMTRLTLVLPARVCGASPACEASLEAIATAWGLSYQIMDDFHDLMLQQAETGKTVARDAALNRPNLPLVIGMEPALQRLIAWLDESRNLISDLVTAVPGFEALVRLQGVLESEQRALITRLQTVSRVPVATESAA